jgi:hypothetical protein
MAERAGEWYLREVLACILTRRAFRTQFHSVDFFASDVMGKMADGTMVFAQVTAGQSEALRTRRRKLEKVPWQLSDRVMVLQLTSTPDPANNRKTLWFFRVHDLLRVMSEPYRTTWEVDETACLVPAEWFKAYKPEGDPEADD